MELWTGQIDQLLHAGSNLADAYGDRRTNEELVRALVGEKEGSGSLNIHTGLKVSCEISQDPPQSSPLPPLTRRPRRSSSRPWWGRARAVPLATFSLAWRSLSGN